MLSWDFRFCLNNAKYEVMTSDVCGSTGGAVCILLPSFRVTSSYQGNSERLTNPEPYRP